MNELITITNDNKFSARELYSFLELADGQFSRWAKTNIVENEFALLGEDYEGFDIYVEGNKTVDYKLTPSFAKKLCMISKSPRGEQARNYFIAVEDRLKELSKPKTIEDLIIMQAQSVKELKGQVAELTGTIGNIKEAVISEPDNWREDINRKFNKIAQAIGTNKFQEVRAESYKLLEQRAGVNLDRRLFNKRARMLEEGMSSTSINKANKLDIINEDKKLKEIYSKIIQEYYIKYVA